MWVFQVRFIAAVMAAYGVVVVVSNAEIHEEALHAQRKFPSSQQLYCTF